MSGHQLLELRPQIRPELRISRPLRRGSAVVHLVRDPRADRVLEIGVKERFLIGRLDGTRSLAEVGEEYAREFRARLGEPQWQQLLRLLYGRGLLTDAPPPAAGPPEPKKEPPSGVLAGRVTMVSDPPALLARLHGLTGFARTRWFLALLTALLLAELLGIALRLGTLVTETGRLLHQPVALLAVGCLLWVSLALHELAHGLVGHRYGGRVTGIGLRWRLPMSYLYCEVEDVQFFARRREQVATALAGAVANLVFLLPFYPAWALLPERAQARPFLAGLLLLGVVTAFANLVPLPPLDGYKVLGYAAASLRPATESRRFAGLLLRRDRAALRAYPRGLRWLYGGYALGCALLAAAVLAAAGPVCRALLPSRFGAAAWYAPPALVAAALALWALGQAARARRRRVAERRAAQD
ncbi:peptidase M50 [Kitasatospora sp. MMS16-BH015]|uniref:metalloprotease n=1 Tax=Kitasatospora sp. MMS16-BH015 TaxID=2018025 RepID=UPI000CA13269|nr:M50 family metallopeptidase [Kitasatospora sp. MMS16-BH015]AUG80480.1 peptidase M50 [Kitasatospora sp. MMS16-BH015]